MYRYGYNAPRLKDMHHIEDLKRESDRVIDQFKRIEEEKKELEQILSNITNRATEVLQYDYYYKAECWRREEYNTKHIFYELRVYKIPKTDKLDHYTRSQIFYMKIPGRDGGKKKAIIKANELKKEYNCIDLKFHSMEVKS